ncbi:MAG: helix-turn-helix domain-containing protein, partial [Planctomycetota bacterium]
FGYASAGPSATEGQRSKLSIPRYSHSGWYMIRGKASATKAAKKLGLLGCGRGELLAQANRVETPSECAAVLIDCLAALPQSGEPEAEQSMTVREVADVLNVSESTVYRLVNEQILPHNRVRGLVRVSLQQLAEYQNQ